MRVFLLLTKCEEEALLCDMTASSFTTLLKHHHIPSGGATQLIQSLISKMAYCVHLGPPPFDYAKREHIEVL